MGFTCSYDHYNYYTYYLNAPDGITYAVKMSGWYWNVIDYLDQCDGNRWPRKHIYQTAWDVMWDDWGNGIQRGNGSVQDEFIEVLKRFVYELWDMTESRLRGYANDGPLPVKEEC